MRCHEGPVLSAGLGEFIHKNAVGAGAGAGVLAVRLSSSVGARVVARSAVRRSLGMLVSRVATSAAAGSGGLICGPFAPACIPALAIGAWLGVDWLVSTVDEMLSREAMKEEMMIAVSETLEELAQSMHRHYSALAVDVFAQIEAAQNERFIINRDGLPGDAR